MSIGLPSLLLALFTLFKILEIKTELAMIIIGFLGIIAEINILYYYLKTEKLIKRIENIILEDPMEEWIKKALKDLFPTLLIIIILWIAIITIVFH
jgi:cell division protein ZapA (FtsZ GTPase activity inhibitor)